jgi:septal ring factor EnvC (AmiA/AmiB activator)
MNLDILNGWLLAAATAAAAVLWWLFRTAYSRIEAAHARAEKTESALDAFKLEAAKTYVTSSALEKALDNLNDTIKLVFAKLERIDEKLANKADRT